MPCKIKNPANIDLTHLEPKLHSMYDHFEQKYGFNKPPTMYFDSDPNNQSNILGKTAYYDPGAFEIHVFTDGRHPKDMLRSIAHELIHHRQNLEDEKFRQSSYRHHGTINRRCWGYLDLEECRITLHCVFMARNEV